jgi:hypothetical protein
MWKAFSMTAIDPVLTEAAPEPSGREGTVLALTDGPDRPDLVLIDWRAGLYAIDLDPDGTTPDDRRPWVALNRKRALDPTRPSMGRVVLSRTDFTEQDWPNNLPRRAMADADFVAVVDQLVPSVVFTSNARTRAVGPGAAARAATRLQLDVAQAATASAPIANVALVTGPLGSGKTLLPAARARELRRMHLEWDVATPVYYRALVPHVTRSVDDPEATVTTMGRFAHRLGVRMGLSDNEQAEADYRRARERGILRVIDALLGDEVQDFAPARLRFAVATDRPDRGGTLLVGDQAQGLYRDADPGGALTGHDIVRYTLTGPYRSTKQGLPVTAVLTGQPVAGTNTAPDGDPVDLIWADTKDAQLDCVTWEIATLLKNGSRQPNEIAVSITLWRGTGKLCPALTGCAIILEVFNKKYSLGFGSTTWPVKVIAAHSAKGCEFPVVFLIFLEIFPRVPTNRAGDASGSGSSGPLAPTANYCSNIRSPRSSSIGWSFGADVRYWIWPDDYQRDDHAEVG